jgi:hypothetical protein
MRARILLAAALAITTFSLPAFTQSTPAKPAPKVMANPPASSTAKVYPLDQIVTATVHDAWEMSGKNEEAFFNIVQQLAEFSAEKRGLTLPDTAAAGRRMGVMIKTKTQADHDQLLYAIVDQAVRTVGTKPTTTASK